MRDRLLAFIGGDILVTINFIHTEEILRVMLLGFIGGFVGLAGKEFYHFVEQKIKQWRK